MRTLVLSAMAALALAAGAPTVRAGERGDAAPSREAAVLRWVLTYAPVNDALRARIEVLAASAKPESHDELFSIGEPARRVLLGLAATDPALAERTAALRAKMQDLQDEVQRRSLHTDLVYLSTAGTAGAARVARIVPAEAPRNRAVEWCMERAGSIRWEPTLDRWVLAPGWDRDQAPRRWRHRDTVTLRNSEGIVRLGGPYTAEFWVRWPSGHHQYLLSDECWPGMSQNVPVDRERGIAFRRSSRGDGTATLDLTSGIGPRGWAAVESAPLRISTYWQHIAFCSDGRVIRLFRDGELVAAKDFSGVDFVRGVGDMALGVRPDGWHDRRAEFDLRAVRLSESARYVSDFVPPRRFEKDASTSVLLDFTPGNETLRDLSGRGHDASGQGRWIPPLDLEEMRAELAVFGASAGEAVLAEAESGGWSGQWWASDRSQFSNGVNLEIWSDIDPGAEGHTFSVPFRVPRKGRYRLHFVGAGLHRGDEGVSPFSWRVDDQSWTVVNSPLPALYGLLGEPDRDVSPLGVVELGEGEHVFRVRLLSRRRHADRRWSVWCDAIVLTAVSSGDRAD